VITLEIVESGIRGVGKPSGPHVIEDGMVDIG
jgi:hypothetical protein